MENRTIDDFLFGWHVKEHVERDWPKVRPYVEEGMLRSVSGKKVTVGKYENEYYGGTLVLANGETLAQKLIDDEVVLDESLESPVKVESIDDLGKYYDMTRDEDGAHIFDRHNKQVYHIGILNNGRRVKYMHLLPEDFVSPEGQGYTKIGTKTHAATVLPQLYENAESYQIKKTAATPLGTGKVTHFDREGLAHEFFLAYMPGYKGDFIDAEKKVVGVLRVYDRTNGVSAQNREEFIIGASELEKISNYSPTPCYSPNGHQVPCNQVTSGYLQG